MTVTVAEDWQPVVAGDAVSPFRRRLLDGLAASIGERGYRDTTVADIVRHARTSKRTFYGEFSSKEECFIELLAAGNREMIARIRGAVDPEADWRDQIRQAVDAWVDDIEARPAITPELDSRASRTRSRRARRCSAAAWPRSPTCSST